MRRAGSEMNTIRQSRRTRFRLTPPAALVVPAVVALSLLAGWSSASDGADTWIRWIEAPTSDLLRRLVTAGLLAAGALTTFRVAARLCGNAWVALAVSLATVWAFPGRGSEAGFLVFALVLWAGDRYIDRPGREGFWLLTLLTVVVSQMRSDAGIYVAGAAVGALFSRHIRDGARAFGRAALGYAGSLAVLVLMFVPLGQVHAAVNGLDEQLAAAVTARRPVIDPAKAELLAEAPQPDGPTFNIRWSPGVTASQRAVKERQYGLEGEADIDDASGRTWRYVWNDWSRGDVLRLLKDPAVEDTHRIDRTTGEYTGARRGLRFPSVALWIPAARPGLRWLWVIVPGVAILRMAGRAMRRRIVHTPPGADTMVVPALVLCAAVGGLVIQGAGDLVPVAAPVMPALAVLSAWLVTPPAAESFATTSSR